MPLNKPIIWLLLENIRSIYNVGAIFRTADAAGVDRILLAGLTPLPERLEASKTALGTLRSTPSQYFPNPLTALEYAHSNGLQSVALEQSSQSTNLYQTQLQQQILLIIGHERHGVSSATLAAVNKTIYLPMLGEIAHSLNVSTATGIALYELRRRAWYS